MSENFPPRPTAAQAAEIARKQRGRNVALLVVLLALAVIFFAMTIIKLGKF